MINRIKEFIVKHDVEIAVTACVVGGVLLGAWTTYYSVSRGKEILVLPKNAAKDLLAGKDILVDCLEDASLLIKYIPKA